MDDERFFPFENDRSPRNDSFLTLDKENTPATVRYKTKKRFEKKLLVWVAISGRGHSDVLFRASGRAVNGKV